MSLLGRKILLLRKEFEKEAYKISLELEKQSELDTIDYSALSWTSYDYIKTSIQNKQINIDQINFNFQRYLNCPFPKDSTNDSLIHKCMMSKAIKIKEMTPSFNLYDFFIKSKNKFGIAYPDYWEQFKTENDRICNSLMEKLISTLSKHPAEILDTDSFCNFIDSVILKFPENNLLIYYKAKLLLDKGYTQQATNIAISFAKTQLDLFWVWSFLGEIYKSQNTNLSIACFTKSLLCRDEEKFKYKNHLELSRLFYQQKKFDLAKNELEKYLEIQKKNGWKLDEKIIDQTQKNWFISAPNIDMEPIYKDLSIKATDIFTENLEWLSANIGEYCFKEKNKRIIYVKENNNIYAIPFYIHDDLKKLDNGSALEIKGEKQSNKFKIYSYRILDNSNLWSLATKKTGVISRVISEKKIVNLLFNDFTENYKHIQNINSYKIGDFIEATILKKINKDSIAEDEIVEIEKITNIESSNLIKKFSGIIHLKSTKNGKTIGFADDIFIPERLIVKIDLVGNEHIEGKAIQSFDKRKECWGWSAYEIKEV